MWRAVPRVAEGAHTSGGRREIRKTRYEAFGFTGQASKPEAPGPGSDIAPRRVG